MLSTVNTPDSSGWSQRTQRGIAASTRAGLDTRNETQRGSIVSVSSNASRYGHGSRSATQAADQGTQLGLDDLLRQVLVGQPLEPLRRGSAGEANAARTWSSKKWANGP